MTDCLNENELLARVSGKLPSERAAEVDAHVDQCAECRILLAEAAHWLEEPRARTPSATTFGPGDVVADRYVIVKLLGTGGMGEVYEARDRVLAEDIALKTLIPAIADDERALTRLHAEVRMARRVTHVNVCRIYDLGVHERGEERIAFLTMELVRGTNLRRHLQKVGRLQLSDLLPLVEQMVAALRHAHAAGIIHRDFKSDNVLLVTGETGDACRVVVTDFGLALQSLVHDRQPLTPPSRTVLGTLDYMSPEQVMGKSATPASDVYSLGIVIYEMLTGELPFTGDSPLARAVQRVTRPAPRLDVALPRAGGAASACIARCLETDPERRFSTVDEVLDALRGNSAVRSRTRGTAAGAAAGAVALLVASAIYLAKGRAPAEPRARHEPAQLAGAAASAAEAFRGGPRERPAGIAGSTTQVVSAPLAAEPAPVPPPRITPHRKEPPERTRPRPLLAPREATSAPVPHPEAVPNGPEVVPTGDALLDPFVNAPRTATSVSLPAPL